MTQPSKSSEDPVEGADKVPARQPGSPTPAKDAPPTGQGSAHEPDPAGAPDAAPRR